MLVKTLRYIFFIKFVFLINLSYCQKDYSKILRSSDSTYGYSANNPIKLKDGNQQKSIANSVIFLKGLKMVDDQTLKFVSRYSVIDPNYKKPLINLTNRYTGIPLNGKLGILDKYVFVTSHSKDTITLYIDVYNKGLIKLPMWLKWYDQFAQ